MAPPAMSGVITAHPSPAVERAIPSPASAAALRASSWAPARAFTSAPRMSRLNRAAARVSIAAAMACSAHATSAIAAAAAASATAVAIT